MTFAIKEKSGIIPDLDYGSRQSELSCFIPEGYDWEQTNYGQGEGQVRVEGSEWGFYYSDDGINITLHEGIIPLSEAVRFVEKVAEKIYGQSISTVEIYAKAED